MPHSDPSRKHLNVCYIDEPIEIAYMKLFGRATEEYNKGKKPSRQIKNYYQHIMKQYQTGQEKLEKAISSGASREEIRRIKSRYPKPYYEVIISLANRDCYEGAFSTLGKNAEMTAEILNRYMEDFPFCISSAFLARMMPLLTRIFLVQTVLFSVFNQENKAKNKRLARILLHEKRRKRGKYAEK